MRGAGKSMLGIRTRLAESVDIAPLVFFRIVAGTLIALETIGQVVTDYRDVYVGAELNFHYLLTPWLQPWSPPGVFVHFGFNIAAAIAVAAGYRTRLTAAALGVGTLSLLLMEPSVYINHTYLYALTALLLCLTPCGEAISLDVAAGRSSPRGSAPAWCLYALRLQLGIVYVYSGIAKFDPDWLAALPLEIWLRSASGYPVIGPVFALSLLPHVLAWGGLFFDLLVVPGMLWRRTRAGVFAVAVAFHLTNVIVFGLGTFPWFALAMTSLFFEPETFRRIGFLARRLPPDISPSGSLPSFATVVRDVDPHPTLAARERSSRDRLQESLRAVAQDGRRSADERPVALWLLVTLCIWFGIQLFLPLQPLLYAGRASWTEEGHTFAWRMMLRTKTGSVSFEVRDPATGETWTENAIGHTTRRQYLALIKRPELIRQYAHHLAETYAGRGRAGVEVRARAICSLNGRAPRLLVDPRVNLAAERGRLSAYPWIRPEEPR